MKAKVIVLLYFIQLSMATLQPFSMWGDRMVLQSNDEQGKEALIWGTASSSATVSLLIEGKMCNSTIADKDGKWVLSISKASGGPYTVTLTEKTQQGLQISLLQSTEVFFGDVMVCSGQSNLEFPMSRIDNAKSELAASDYPSIHIFSAVDNNTFPANGSSIAAAIEQPFLPIAGKDHGGMGTPHANVWFTSNATTVKDFSALCFLVARELVRDGHVKKHIGLIQSAKGGTPVQGWIPGSQATELLGACGMDPDLPIFTQGGSSDTEWSRTSTLYNQMIAPIAGYTSTAVIWDQGEANMDEGYMLRREQYACVFRQMIVGWRNAWNLRGNKRDPVPLPFIFPQLHACGSQKNHCSNKLCAAGSWDTIRMAQADVFATLPNTGMAITYDQGFKGVHSPHKQAVGHRLTLELLRVAYGREDLPSGPVVQGACVKSMDPLTNATTVELHLLNAKGLIINATQGCSDCCKTEGGSTVAKGLFQISKASSYYGESWVDATMLIAKHAATSNDSATVYVNVTTMGPMKGLQIFGLRYAYGNLPQCQLTTVDNQIPLAPFDSITISPSCLRISSRKRSFSPSPAIVYPLPGWTIPDPSWLL